MNFDDGTYVVENIHIQSGLTWSSLKWAFTTGHAANWHPLTWLSHMVDRNVFGLAAWGHHLSSLILHITATILLFACFRDATGATLRSFVLAALFGIHPLHVESVAWVAERKDVLSGLFWFAALNLYIQYVRRCEDRRKAPFLFYWLSFVCFLLGLMSKPMLVTFPLVLLLFDYWPLRRFNKNGKGVLTSATRLLKEKIPFLLGAVASGLITFIAQLRGGAMVIEERFTWPIRLANMPISYCRYLAKIFYPVNLSAYYPHPVFWPPVEITAATSALVAVSAMVILFTRRYPFLVTGWLWFVVTLLPVIGLIQVGTQAIADRYTYIPSIGIFVIICWGVPEVVSHFSGSRLTVGSAAASMLLLCGWQTHKQIGYWKNSETLFRHALSVQSDNTLAHLNLGVALQTEGRLDEAIKQYDAAIALNPNVAACYFSRGGVLIELGRLNEAITDLETGLRIAPRDAKAHLLLGNASQRKGDLQDAIRELQAAATLDPELVEAHNNLGLIFRQNGLLKPAIEQYRQAIAVNPNYADGHNNLGIALLMDGQSAEAISHFARAAQLNPNSSGYRCNYAAILEENHRPDEAIVQYKAALGLDPNNVKARQGLSRLESGQSQSR